MPRRDHPRVCGEHLLTEIAQLADVGSSPRVRGTRNLFFRLFFSRDHPRVCGEHEMALTDEDIMRGSSPRVRGTPELRYKYEVNGGIIPACAGNTSTTRERRCRPRDHPRVCGEHSLAAYTITLNPGSSPRVRGTRFSGVGHDRAVGIIPACAGNTEFCMLNWGMGGDHPRVCGEHRTLLPTRSDTAGSSPRVRGTPSHPIHERRWSGIIPACAGNTSHSSHRHWCRRDHPRVCGEHLNAVAGGNADTGSSPRVRGTPFGADSDLPSAGIIPACAGNTHKYPE